MYQVLYRKWRPKAFDDVVGQTHITKTLKNQIKNNRAAHAYLFTGSRGTGKTTCAKILAKAVNCLDNQNGDPCCSCQICQNIEKEQNLDITEIDAASNNGVDNIRAIREETNFVPGMSKFRIYIVDEVHMLSIGAFNALLKILEEPPNHVIFILATTEHHKVPLTIISRCQRFAFKRISIDDMFTRLKHICDAEKIKISDEAIKLICKYSDGAMRDALSVLDQCTNQSEKTIDEEKIIDILGVSDQKIIVSLIKNILSGNIEKSLTLLDELYKNSKNLVKLCEDVMNFLREILIQEITKHKNNDENIGEFYQKISVSSLLDMLRFVQESYKNMNFGFNKLIEVQTLLIKLCNIQQNFESKNTEVKNTGFRENLNTNKEIFVKNEHDEWTQIIENFCKKINDDTVLAKFKNSRVHKNKDYFLIDSDDKSIFEYLKIKENRMLLKEAIKEITGEYYKLGPYIPKEQSLELLENDLKNIKS